MNIHEAAKSGKPFRHPNMIGAWMVYDLPASGEHIVHRDHIEDFKNREWILANCIDTSTSELHWMSAYDLLRTDWEIVE